MLRIFAGRQNWLLFSIKGKARAPLLYLTLKTLHLVAVVAWFAGLFYLPRLFVYHCEVLKQKDRKGHDRFCVMERRLIHIITTPAGLITVLTGFSMLAMQTQLIRAGWMQAVLLLSAALIAFHLYCILCHLRLVGDNNRHSSRFYRIFNEFPTLILIAVMALFTFRPGG